MYRYQRARQQALTDPVENPQAGGLDAAEAAFERSRALQRSFFGAHADALFHRQNALGQYLLQRRRLRADAGLSEAGKSSALEQLRQSYEAQQ